jgi:hypothetical protein
MDYLDAATPRGIGDDPITTVSPVPEERHGSRLSVFHNQNVRQQPDMSLAQADVMLVLSKEVISLLLLLLASA